MKSSPMNRKSFSIFENSMYFVLWGSFLIHQLVVGIDDSSISLMAHLFGSARNQADKAPLVKIEPVALTQLEERTQMENSEIPIIAMVNKEVSYVRFFPIFALYLETQC